VLGEGGVVRGGRKGVGTHYSRDLSRISGEVATHSSHKNWL